VLFGAVLACLLVSVAPAADSLTLRISADPTEVAPGGTTTVTVKGCLTEEVNNSNRGLAFFAYDLRVNGPIAVSLSTAAAFSPALPAVQASAVKFHRQAGFSMCSIPAEGECPAENDLFNGVPDGNNLIQLGGGQNTINNDPQSAPFVPFPNGTPDLDVGQGGNCSDPSAGATLHVFELTMPAGALEGQVYTVEAIPGSIVANMIKIFDGTNYSVDPVPSVSSTSAQITIRDCTDITAPEVMQAQALPGETAPCTGYIDPRIENLDLGDLTPKLGVTTVSFKFSEAVEKVGGGALDASNFDVVVTGGVAPTVTNVATADDITFNLTLSTFPPLRQWTTIIAVDVEDAGCGTNLLTPAAPPNQGPGVPEPDRIDIGALPGDINQDGSVTPLDLINLRQRIASNYNSPCDDRFYFDIDRDGAFPLPTDLIKFRQILGGAAPATQVWSGVNMLATQP